MCVCVCVCVCVCERVLIYVCVLVYILGGRKYVSVGPSLAQETIHAEGSMLLSAYIRNQPLGEVSQKFHNTVVSRVNAHGQLEFTGKKKPQGGRLHG